MMKMKVSLVNFSVPVMMMASVSVIYSCGDDDSETFVPVTMPIDRTIAKYLVQIFISSSRHFVLHFVLFISNDSTMTIPIC